MAHDGSKAYAGSVLNLFNAMFPLSDLFCQNRFFLLHGMEFSKHTKFFKIRPQEAEISLTSGAHWVQKCTILQNKIVPLAPASEVYLYTAAVYLYAAIDHLYAALAEFFTFAAHLYTAAAVYK